jgi:hypothetical protein
MIWYYPGRLPGPAPAAVGHAQVRLHQLCHVTWRLKWLEYPDCMHAVLAASQWMLCWAAGSGQRWMPSPPTHRSPRQLIRELQDRFVVNYADKLSTYSTAFVFVCKSYYSAGLGKQLLPDLGFGCRLSLASLGIQRFPHASTALTSSGLQRLNIVTSRYHVFRRIITRRGDFCLERLPGE